MHKTQEEKKGEWAEIEEIEIQPLSDYELEVVMGGASPICSVTQCSGGGCNGG